MLVFAGDVDTGCAYGGLLSGYRYPEGDILSVAARHTYAPKGGRSCPAARVAATQHQRSSQPHVSRRMANLSRRVPAGSG